MKISVSQKEMARGLSIVSRAVAAKSSLPVLSNVLLSTDNGRLKIAATNLEIGVTCWIGARVNEDGAITVPAKILSELVSTLPNETVDLSLNRRTQTINVRCGGSKTDIKGIDAQEFPPIQSPDSDGGIELKVSELKNMIQQVSFATSSDDARPVLQGVLVVVKDNLLTLAATDGFRISVSKTMLSGNTGDFSAIIPAKALNELSRIASDGEEQVVMMAGKNQAVFRLKDSELVSQLIEGNFPDFQAIIPKRFKTGIVMTTAALSKACKQAEIIARESNNVIRMTIGNEDVVLSAQSEETGSSEVKVDSNVSGPELVIAFNVKFLREALDIIKTPNVSLNVNENNTPAVLRAVGEDNFTHVIMPMHLG